MSEEGYLSIWIGSSESDSTLEDYVRLDYTDDGELVPSALLRDFELTDSDGDYDEYEEGCREMSLFDRGALESCLQKFSYANQFCQSNYQKGWW